MSAGGRFVKKLKKNQIPYWSKMARNAIESEFRTSKMADDSHFVKNFQKKKIPCSLGIVRKLASLNRHGIHADRWENGFSTHNATYRGINPTGLLITVRLKMELY